MNEAVVKFYKSGQTTTGALKQSLMLLKNQVPAAEGVDSEVLGRRGHSLAVVQVLPRLLSLSCRFTPQQTMRMVWMM